MDGSGEGREKNSHSAQLLFHVRQTVVQVNNRIKCAITNSLVHEDSQQKENTKLSGHKINFLLDIVGSVQPDRFFNSIQKSKNVFVQVLYISGGWEWLYNNFSKMERHWAKPSTE